MKVDQMQESFSDSDKEAIYRVIKARRDIRKFSTKPLDSELVMRLLEAAHFAPSVGFMQPWNFILIQSLDVRSKIKALFDDVNAGESAKLTERKELYNSLKLEGILESPLNIAVTCDHRRDAPFVLGRGPMPETDVFSTCLAIQNLWLAARAEEVGIGWVSLIDHKATEKLLNLPEGVRLVAYLCVGYPVEFKAVPMLEEVGWKKRTKLATLVYKDQWGVTEFLMK